MCQQLTGSGGMDFTILYRTQPAPPTTAALPNCTAAQGHDTATVQVPSIRTRSAAKVRGCLLFGSLTTHCMACLPACTACLTETACDVHTRVVPPHTLVLHLPLFINTAADQHGSCCCVTSVYCLKKLAHCTMTGDRPRPAKAHLLCHKLWCVDIRLDLLHQGLKPLACQHTVTPHTDRHAAVSADHYC